MFRVSRPSISQSATWYDTSWFAPSLPLINSTARPRPPHANERSTSTLMLDFLKRGRLIRRGLASRKTRRRRTRNELLRNLEYSLYVKVFIFAGFVAGLAFLVFSGQQPEPTKNFVIALLFFATALIQLWINQPKTFSQNSRVLLV